jgi:hypothetical protein
MTQKIHDRTGWIPFVLFGIFAVIVAYNIYKGTKKPKTEPEPVVPERGII